MAPNKPYTIDSLLKALKHALQEAHLLKSIKVYLTQEQVWAISLILNRAKILDPKKADSVLGEAMFAFKGDNDEKDAEGNFGVIVPVITDR
jgi:CRISPR/Cas system endoribonuclease Cas6 (RAMP superfamily)